MVILHLKVLGDDWRILGDDPLKNKIPENSGILKSSPRSLISTTIDASHHPPDDPSSLLIIICKGMVSCIFLDDLDASIFLGLTLFLVGSLLIHTT